MPLLTAGLNDNLLWYVIPRVDGESLRERIARQGHLAFDDAVRVVAFPANVRESGCCARFGVVPSDQRFLMIQTASNAAGSGGTKIVLVTNLLAELRQKGGAAA